MLNTVNNSYVLALDLAELLVQEKNIPFRQSHKIVASLVKDSKNPKDIFNKEKLQNYILEITEKKIDISEQFIKELSDLNTCLNKRISQGSPSKLEVEKNISLLKIQKNHLFNLYEKRIQRIQNAENLLKQKINELIS